MRRNTVIGVILGGVALLGVGTGWLIGGGMADDTAAASSGGVVTTTTGDAGSDSSPATSDPTNSSLPAPTSGDCEIPAGEPLVGGPSVDLIDLGESNGARVQGVVYPHPDYEAELWSQWGQGIVLPDGRFISALGDHKGVDGNSFIYEFDPSTGRLSMIADVLSYVDHVPGTWAYGKIHAQMVPGPCGEIYLSTYWGTYRNIQFEGNYRGDILMRLDPYGRTLQALDVPVDLMGQASMAASPDHGLVYGEAIDPVSKDQDIDEGPFFAYDVTTGETVFVGPNTPHVGFRAMIVDGQGRAYYSIGGAQLAVYDPSTGELSTHGETMPGDWLRAATELAEDGSVYAVTRDPDIFFVLRPDGQIEELGAAPDYTASMALSPDGEVFYFLPGAHGDSWEMDSPLIAVDTATGEQTVVAELNELVEESLGLRLGGTYNVAVSPEGDRVYVGANVGPIVSDDSGFGEVALLVINLP